MKHILSGKMASSEEIRMYFPVAVVLVSTTGFNLVESHKNITIHRTQCNLAKNRQVIFISILYVLIQ